MSKRQTILLALAAQATADCACGYTLETVAPKTFTDILETDFFHTYDFTPETARSMGWIQQDYDQTNTSGPFGMAKMAANVAINPLKSIFDWGGEGIKGGDPGLQLAVKSALVYQGGTGCVPSAEIVSDRDDILYGSFRIAMKTTRVNGTCAAFLFYRNDTQEIDVELLSAQQFTDDRNSHWPVNLVVRNTTVPLALNGSDPQSQNLQYHMIRRPDGEIGEPYVEYRFDWLPDRIDFYVDGWKAASFTDNVPSTPGAIHFGHWSNGNPFWSLGPPLEDAVMTVAYIKAYFNTTSIGPASGRECDDPNDGPWPGSPNGNETGKTYFFSRELNMSQPHDSGPPLKASASARAVEILWQFAAMTVVVYFNLRFV